jgi:hypothetical protein
MGRQGDREQADTPQVSRALLGFVVKLRDWLEGINNRLSRLCLQRHFIQRLREVKRLREVSRTVTPGHQWPAGALSRPRIDRPAADRP